MAERPRALDRPEPDDTLYQILAVKCREPLAENEQVELNATALNGLAIATVIAGFLSPIVALGDAASSRRTDSVAVAASFGWLLIGVILHLCGRLTLLGIEE